MTNDKTDIIMREKRRQELGETEFSSGAQGGALMQPRNGKELMDMANLMSSAGTMIRDFYRKSPGDCAALIMICQPYGLNPYMTSWKTYKASKNADAPVSFEAQLVMAMVNQSAPVKGRLRYSYNGQGPTRTCTVTGIDRETGEEIVYTTPMLKDIRVKNSPLWKDDPDQQLGYYAARSWARRHFPELLLGVYTREEISEAPARDITPKTEDSGLAKRLKAAQSTSEVVEEPSPDVENLKDDLPARDINDDVEDAEPVQDYIEAEVFPGSDEFTMGAKIYQAGGNEDDNPFANNPEFTNWLGGFRQAESMKEDGQ